MGCRAIKSELPGRLNSLLELSARGEREAFDEIIGLIEEEVVRTAFYLTRNLDDARDVAQEVYIRLIRNRAKLPELGNFHGWVYRVTLNAARDHLRRRRVWLPIEKIRSWVAPQDPIESEQLGDRLKGALGRLSFRQRAAFIFRELHELSYAEVADILGCSEVTARGHLMLAREKVRACLEEFKK